MTIIHKKAEAAFAKVAKDLEKKKKIVSYTLDTKDGVNLTLMLPQPHTTLKLSVSPTGEVFSRTFDDLFSSVQTAYTEAEQLEAVDDLNEDVDILVNKQDFEERTYKNRKGKTVFRELVYRNGATESASVVFMGRLRKLIGTTVATK